MLIIDAHLDLAWNALDWNRDLRLPAADIRRRERQHGMTDKGRGEGTVSFPELRRGRVGVFIATLLARLIRPNLVPAIQRYESMEAAYAAAHGQMAYYRALEQGGSSALDQGRAGPGGARPGLAGAGRADSERRWDSS